MFNLYQIMQAAQGGAAMANLAHQFGLTPAQTQSAIGALMPAFAMGMRRQTQSPEMMAAFFGPLASGTYAPFFGSAGPHAVEAAAKAGVAPMMTLFGSNEVTRAVADQAAAASGVAADALQRMMPPVAAMLMGGVHSEAQNQGLAGLFGLLSRGMTTGHDAAAQPAVGGFGAGPAAIDGSLMAFSEMASKMMSGFFGQPKPPATMDSGLDAVVDLFDAGRQLQGQQLEGMAAIFATLAKAGRD